jgi:hypothetical protein
MQIASGSSSNPAVNSHKPNAVTTVTLGNQPVLLNNLADGDSGRASMASNNEQDQCSPTITHRSQQPGRAKNSANHIHTDSSHSIAGNSHFFPQSQEMNINQGKSNSNGNFTHQYNKFKNENLSPKAGLGKLLLDKHCLVDSWNCL